MNAYRTCARQDLRNTEWLGKHLVTIPLYPDLTDGEVERIVSTAKRLGPFIDP
jgi:dTDP-4-amino-4,6-dideoxygalactose transaminase